MKRLQIGNYEPGRLRPGMGVPEILGWAIIRLDNAPRDHRQFDRVSVMKQMVLDNMGRDVGRKLIMMAETHADMARGVPIRHLEALIKEMGEDEFEEMADKQ